MLSVLIIIGGGGDAILNQYEGVNYIFQNAVKLSCNRGGTNDKSHFKIHLINSSTVHQYVFQPRNGI